MDSKPLRTTVLATAFVLGAIAFVGSVLWMVAGGGMYGSPLQGGGSWPRLVLAYLLTGPMALLPGAIGAIWRPRLGGIFLLVMALASAWFAVQVMTPQPGTWSPGGQSLNAYIFKWSCALIAPTSLPLLVIGLCFLRIGRHPNHRNQ